MKLVWVPWSQRWGRWLRENAAQRATAPSINARRLSSSKRLRFTVLHREFGGTRTPGFGEVIGVVHALANRAKRIRRWLG